MTAKLLVIDNYDSFTFNLVQMFRSYDLDISVFRADALSVEDVVRQRPDYVLVSPGPSSSIQMWTPRSSASQPAETPPLVSSAASTAFLKILISNCSS